jgi:hypothetical protein
MAGVAIQALSLSASGLCRPVSDAKREMISYKKLKPKRLILAQNQGVF